jgi:hypothetical protein
MEPFDERQLTEQELSSMLREWQAPRPPGAMRARVLAEAARPWWQRLWTVSIRIPLPVAAVLAVLFALALWRWVMPVPARVVIHTERVEVPVTVYKDRPAPTIYGLHPVAELRPRIIRSGHARN